MEKHILLLYVQIFVGLSILASALGQKRMLLKDVDVLTLYKNKQTTGRRSSPVPQLFCSGGFTGCETVDLPVVQCYNRGFDGNDYQWECKADMPSNFKFGKIEVSCEGYDYPDDPYVLSGSCGLQYELINTKEGGDYGHKESHSYNKKTKSDGSSSSSLFVIICFIGIVVVVLWFSKTRQPPSPTSDPTHPPPYGFRDQHSPPPPYTDDPNRQPPPPGFNTGGSNFNPPPSSSYGFKTANDQHQQQQQQPSTGQNAFGGFWTGAGVGGLMGYLFGSRRNNNNLGGAYNDPYGTGSSFFGGGGSGYRNFGNRGGGGWFGSGGSSWGSSSPSSSSTTTESRTTSGFGGTKRR